MKVYKIIISLFIFILISSNIFSQKHTGIPRFIKDSLDTFIEQNLKKWKVPGISVCIVKDGKPVLVKGYGIKEIGKPDKVNENTLFMIGSNSKAFTGTVLAMLEYEKKCSFEDKVQKWIPEFKMKDPWVAKNLNLTDILCHRIGMETFQGDFIYWTSNLNSTEVIKKFGQLTPTYGFRTKWGYTNAGFLLAGECIQKISGISWAENVKSRLFNPLNMTHSLALSADLAKQKDVATPYTMLEDSLIKIPYPMIDNLAPAGSISSCATDMGHWLICQLDSGKFENNKVIPYPVIKETRKPQSILGRGRHPFNKSHYLLYGMGWEMQDYEGVEIISHTGGVNGFVSSVTMVPEENLGIVILTNTGSNALFESLKWDILDAFLGLPFRNYSQMYYNYTSQTMQVDLKKIKAWKDSVKMNIKPAFDLKNFVGKYVHEVYGKADISIDGKSLKISFEHHPKLFGKLEFIGKDRVLCTYNDPDYGIMALNFRLENNKVKLLLLHVADFIDFMEYEFVKE